MYVNNREQINHHSFMTALRNKHGYSLKKVCTGVCGESGMNRFEKGNRVAEKLMRDRIIARLGISCEKFEDYLQPKEYAKWEKRMHIVQAIKERRLEVAKQELKAYENSSNLNCVQKQFIEAMHFMILTLEGASEEVRRDCIKRAVSLTVPNQKQALEGMHLLSVQEINLILEQIRLEKSKEGNQFDSKWRLTEYEKLLAYIENSCWEDIQKAKIYPKVVYYICLELLSQKLTEDNRSDFCFLYYENECYNIVKVLECRRKMLGFSRTTLGEGVCSAKTIIRFEREGVSPSLELTRRLFEKMGICAEYRRAMVVTTDVDALFLWDEITRNLNNGDYEEGEANLKRLKKLLHMDIPQNQQELLRLDTLLKWKRKEISAEDFSKNMEKALEYTLPLEALKKEGEKFLSRNERLLVCDFLK